MERRWIFSSGIWKLHAELLRHEAKRISSMIEHAISRCPAYGAQI
jgi:hypothetical protein